MEKQAGRDNLIHRICWSILKQRLTGLNKYRDKLKRMSDEDLVTEAQKYLS